jgi:hypothetical protein
MHAIGIATAAVEVIKRSRPNTSLCWERELIADELIRRLGKY